MILPNRVTATTLLVVAALQPMAASAGSSMLERFDEEVGRLDMEARPPGGPGRQTRSAADFRIDRRLDVRLDFPGDVPGRMYSGAVHGEEAVFTRAGDFLDATVMRDGEAEIMSFDASTAERGPVSAVSATTHAAYRRSARSIGPGHAEDPGAYTLQVHFLKHDDLYDRSARELHARYVAWWLADMARRVLPVEPLRVSYIERAPMLTSVPYGDAGSLDTFEATLKALRYVYGTHVDQTYKHKYVLLTARPPMPGTTGVAFEGGNEAIASVSGRTRIVAHEIGHMLGATHADAETRGWWGCETNMLSHFVRWRSDCLQYSAANERAMRSYMRHGPDAVAPRKMVDGPDTD